MILSRDDFHEILELEAIYDNAVDYRTNMVRPRHTITTYYYIKTDQTINPANMNLTADEIKKNFKNSFADKETLIKMLSEEHKEALNWQMFYEENQVIVNNILKK